MVKVHCIIPDETLELKFTYVVDQWLFYNPYDPKNLSPFEITSSDPELGGMLNIDIENEEILFEAYHVCEEGNSATTLIRSVPLSDIFILKPKDPKKKTQSHVFLPKDYPTYQMICQDLYEGLRSNKYVFFRITGIPYKDLQEKPVSAASKLVFNVSDSNRRGLNSRNANEFELPDIPFKTPRAQDIVFETPRVKNRLINSLRGSRIHGASKPKKERTDPEVGKPEPEVKRSDSEVVKPNSEVGGSNLAAQSPESEAAEKETGGSGAKNSDDSEQTFWEKYKYMLLILLGVLILSGVLYTVLLFLKSGED